MFSGLEWNFPVLEMSGYITDHMTLIMPLLVLIIGVLLAMLVLDGVTESLLKILAFVVGAKTGLDGHPGHKTDLELDDDAKFD